MIEQKETQFTGQNKSEVYLNLLSNAKGLLEGESDLIANLANLSSLIHGAFGFWWTGFYIIKNDELVLGPFQGPVACTRIAKGKGVCGGAWEQNKTLIVPNVHEFPGHIACSAESNSEIVIPFKINDQLFGVLDIDSSDFDSFDAVDAQYLEEILSLLN